MHPPPRLTPYSHSQLQRLLAPRSVAVVGASPRPGSFGVWTVQNLAGFQGQVYPVNPKYPEIAGRRCYPSLAALPEVPDCAIIVAGRDAVEGMVLECAQAGVGGVVIYAAGYAETAKEDAERDQQRLSQIARDTGLRIVGPNCIGLFNYTSAFYGSFSPGIPMDPPRPTGTVGIVSQSGALGVSMSQATITGTSLSHIFTAGNSCDVDVADMVAYLADDPACQAIACLFEGMAQPQRLIAAAELASARGKPLVIFKIATGEQGARAAMSHTGSLAGSNAAYRAAFERAGAVLVDDYEVLIETASFFAKAGAPKAAGVAVASTSGGAAIMAADQAERHGVALPQPREATTAVLRQHVPDFGSVRNPCDVTAQVMSQPGSISAVAGALLEDDQYGALVVPANVSADFTAARMPLFNEVAAAHDKPVCIAYIAYWREGPGQREAQVQTHTPVFHSMDSCFATLAQWQQWHARRAAGPRSPRRASDAAARTRAGELLSDAAAGTALTEREAKQVLAPYGVPVVQEHLAQSRQDAIDAATRLGFPVVMKVESPDIPHKTEAGVVRLNLKTPEEVGTAYDTVLANGRQAVPQARVNGVLVQPMVPPGVEIMVGARIDPQFGPLVVVGLGGVLVELMKDTVVDLAPVTHDEAKAMLGRLKGQAALDGFRGNPGVDRERLADVIVRLSEFAADHADRIAEMDLNPLICAGDRIAAVDALIVLKEKIG